MQSAMLGLKLNHVSKNVVIFSFLYITFVVSNTTVRLQKANDYNEQTIYVTAGLLLQGHGLN